MDAADLAFAGIHRQAEALRAGEVSSSDLVSMYLERIDRFDGELNAFRIVLRERAESEAREADRRIAAGEEAPLLGVPVAVKDNVDVAGELTTLGTAAFDRPATADSAQYRRLREAGAVLIGKTNLPELAIWPFTETPAWGRTRNPWDPSRSVGGSSGGSGAAVAAGLVGAASASDGGGSIRIPASNCGLVGLKPTRQRISEGPLVGDVMSGVTVELCVSRSVRDTARLLEAVHGPAPGDPYVAPPPSRPYTDELDDESGGLRVGIMRRPAIEGVGVDAPCLEAVAKAARLIESLGHEIDEGNPLDMLPAGEGGPDIEDSFLTRWAAGQAATLTQLGMLIGRPITEHDVEPLTWTMAQIGHERTSGRYLLDVGIHQGLSRVVAGWFETGYDLLLTPTMAEIAPPLGEIDTAAPDPMSAFTRCLPSGAFTAIFNITGQPAVSVPLHRTAEGVPVGVQIVAPFGREDLLIRLAAQLEKSAPWAERTPPVFAAAS